MNRVLLIIGGLMVGILAALFVVPVFVDWTRYRGSFEEEATRLLGRDVRVGGKVNLRLLPSPYVRFEKIRVADTKATVGKPLFTAEDFTLWLSVSALLRGEFEASVIELHKPVLTLVLDEKGGGNWTNLTAATGQPVAAPAAFAFDSLRINNGTISVYSATGDERTRFEHINGEVSSPAIEGPYKIAAAFAHAGSPREIRISTAKPEPDGAIRLKGTVRAPTAGINYGIDGKLTDLFQQPRFQGELSARLPLPASATLGAAQDPAKQQATPAQPEASFEFKSGIKADASGAEFNDLALTYDQDGQPQLATGTARVNWRDRTIATAQIHSRWLDLDRVTGRSAKTQLAEQLQRLATTLDGALPLDGQTNIGISLDQVTLGSDIVSGVALKAERKDQILSLEASAGIPGGGRIEAQGVVDTRTAERLFDGDFHLRGTSASRFLTWAGRNTTVPQITRDGPFNVSGKAVLGSTNFAGRNLDIQFAGNRLEGTASWAHGTNGRQITLMLDGAALDLTPFAEPAASPLAALRGIATKLVDWPGPTATAVPGKAADTALPLIVARLRIGQLTAGRGKFQDVATDVRYEAGRLSISELKFGSEAGWSLDIQGDISGLSNPASRGAVTWEMTAGSVPALQEFLTLSELAGPWFSTPERAAALVPVHMAGRLRIGEPGAGTYDVAFDGNLGPTRASGSARLDGLDGKADNWRNAKSDIAITLEGGDIGRMIEQLAPPSWRPAPANSRQPGRIAFRGIGTPRSGLISLATLETAGLATEYRGRVSTTDTAKLALEGELRLASTDIGQSLALVGVRQRASLMNQPASGVFALSGNLDRMQVASARMTAGTAILSGALDIEQRAEGVKLTGKIATSELSLASVLGLITQSRAQAVMGPPPPSQATAQSPALALAASRQSVWSDDVFDLSAVADVEIQIQIDAAKTTLTPELTLGKSGYEVVTKAGRIELKLIEAAVLGGTMTGSLQIERNPVGASAKTALRVNKARLESIAASGTKPSATGAMTLSLDLEGKALSPRHLITTLRGQGEMTIAEGRLDRLSPKGLRETVEAMLAIKGEPPHDELARRLATALGSSAPGNSVNIGQRILALQVAEGNVRFAPLLIETPDGRLNGTTVFDLDAQRFDSEWKIEANAQAPKTDQPTVAAKQRPPLPGVTAVYVGSLAAIGTVEPRLQFDALARELAVRKMERDLDELERLRKLDEERNRLEAERRKQLEAERAAGTPSMSTPAAPPSATVQPAPQSSPQPASVSPSSPASPLSPPATIAPGQKPAQIDVPLPLPPVLVQPPQPASRPPETTNGALVAPPSETPNVPETQSVPEPPSPPEIGLTPAAAPPVRPAQPKAAPKNVFKEQFKAAP